MSDNITMPREVVEGALEALCHARSRLDHAAAEMDCNASVDALRTALAAEQPKPEPVASDDDEEFTREDVTTLLLEVMDWTYAKAHRNRPMTEAEQKVLDDIRTALAAEPTKQEPVAWLSRDEARLALWKAINSREFGNPTDDKLILDHLRQQGLWIGKVTSPVPPENEALRRDAERYRWLRENARVWPSDKAVWADNQIGAAAIWIKQSVDWTDDASFDAAIDAAMEEGT